MRSSFSAWTRLISFCISFRSVGVVVSFIRTRADASSIKSIALSGRARSET
jgi:hypothetical protein